MFKKFFNKEKEKTGVSDKIFWIMIFGCFINSFAMGITYPVIFQETIPSIQNIYVYINLFSVFLNFFTVSFTANKKILNWLNKYFSYLVIIDTLIYIAICLIGIEHKAFRVFGIAFLATTTSLLWFNVFRKTLNLYAEGDELTFFQNTKDKYISFGSLVAALIAIPFIKIPGVFVVASTINIIISLFTGIIDIYCKKEMEKQITIKENFEMNNIINGGSR